MVDLHNTKINFTGKFNEMGFRRAYVNPKEVVVIAKLFVHVLRPAFVLIAYDPVNVVFSGAMVPVYT